MGQPDHAVALHSGPSGVRALFGRTPNSDIRLVLFDHLVGLSKQRRGQVKAEGLGRLKIDHEL
jgi:hypothetical protein